MPGALVGGSTPNASLILNQNTRKWEINVQLNKSFAEQTHDYLYTYHILVPKKIGCDFDLFRSMTNDKTDFNVYARDDNIAIEETDANGINKWRVAVDTEINALIQLDDGASAADTVGCFNRYILKVYVQDGLEMCNLTFCISGILFVQCGQMTEGCDKFPVYIAYQSGAASDGLTTVANDLDASNNTTGA